MRLGIDVLGLTRNERGLFVLECADRRIEANQVIVATGAHATQRRPSFAADLDPQIIQLHADDYRNPSQLQKGRVLVVGAGNSGSEIAVESAQAGHRTWSLVAALARCGGLLIKLTCEEVIHAGVELTPSTAAQKGATTAYWQRLTALLPEVLQPLAGVTCSK